MIELTVEMRRAHEVPAPPAAVYACRYTCDPTQHSVRWEPIEGVGNACVRGSWTVEPTAAGARFAFHNHFVVSLPLPKLLRKLAQGVVEAENTRMVERYLANLCTTFAGGDGRLR